MRIRPVALARAACLLAALACPSLALALPATVVKEDALLAEPNPASARVAPLPANARVETIEKQGFWYKVSYSGKTGWIKMTGLRVESGAGVSAGGLASLASGRAGTGNVVSASGTRGLQAQDLVKAKPNYKVMKQIDKQAPPTAEELKAFAKEGGLKARELAYLPKPEGAQ